MDKKIKNPNLDNKKTISEFLDFNKDFLIRDLEYYIGFKGYFINTLSNVDSKGCYDDFFEKLFKYFTLSFDTKKNVLDFSQSDAMVNAMNDLKSLISDSELEHLIFVLQYIGNLYYLYTTKIIDFSTFEDDMKCFDDYREDERFNDLFAVLDERFKKTRTISEVEELVFNDKLKVCLVSLYNLNIANFSNFLVALNSILGKYLGFQLDMEYIH